MMITVFTSALIAYFISAVIGIAEIFRGKRATSKTMTTFAIVGYMLHTASLIVSIYTSPHVPITALQEAASFFSWSVVLLFFVVEYKYRLGLLGSFVMPIASVLMLFSSILPAETIQPKPGAHIYWHGIHTILAFMGGAVFAAACSVGIMFVVQEHFLKFKKFGGLFEKLPNLHVLDNANNRLLAVGFSLFTVAIIVGALWSNSTDGNYLSGNPKEVLSLITWLIYALVLHARVTIGWRGKKAAILSIAGFSGVLSAFGGLILF